jgi:hypothetical protein
LLNGVDELLRQHRLDDGFEFGHIDLPVGPFVVRRFQSVVIGLLVGGDLFRDRGIALATAA